MKPKMFKHFHCFCFNSLFCLKPWESLFKERLSAAISLKLPLSAKLLVCFRFRFAAGLMKTRFSHVSNHLVEEKKAGCLCRDPLSATTVPRNSINYKRSCQKQRDFISSQLFAANLIYDSSFIDWK